MKFDENGKPTFLDQHDRASYRALLSAIKNSNKLFTITVAVYNPEGVSERQRKFIEVLYAKISEYSGQDYATVEQTLLNNFRKGITLSDMTNTVYNDYLENCILFAQEFFELNITINHNGHIEIKKIK